MDYHGNAWQPLLHRSQLPSEILESNQRSFQYSIITLAKLMILSPTLAPTESQTTDEVLVAKLVASSQR